MKRRSQTSRCCKIVVVCILLGIWFGGTYSIVAQIPQLRSASIWRPERATKIIREKSLSFAEFQLLSDEFPYWEPLDSQDLARINTQLGEYKRWDADFKALKLASPSFIDRCRSADTLLGWWFEYLTDTIIAHSPVGGSSSHVLDMECYCLQMSPTFLVRGQTRSGRAVDVYLGSKGDSLVYAFYQGSYFQKRLPHLPKDATSFDDAQDSFGGVDDFADGEDDFADGEDVATDPETKPPMAFEADPRDELVPFCFYSWRPDRVPPPLPNWVPRVIQRYEEQLKGQINPDIVPPEKPRRPRRRA